MDGNTRLVQFLVNAGALINERDGIFQTRLTLAMHKEHLNTAKVLVENGASVDEDDYVNTQSPITISNVMGQTAGKYHSQHERKARSNKRSFSPMLYASKC